MKTTITNYEKELLEQLVEQLADTQRLGDRIQDSIRHLMLADPVGEAIDLANWTDSIAAAAEEEEATVADRVAQMLEELGIAVADPLTDDDACTEDDAWDAADVVSLRPAATDETQGPLVFTSDEAQSP